MSTKRGSPTAARKGVHGRSVECRRGSVGLRHYDFSCNLNKTARRRLTEKKYGRLWLASGREALVSVNRLPVISLAHQRHRVRHRRNREMRPSVGLNRACRAFTLHSSVSCPGMKPLRTEAQHRARWTFCSERVVFSPAANQKAQGDVFWNRFAKRGSRAIGSRGRRWLAAGSAKSAPTEYPILLRGPGAATSRIYFDVAVLPR